MAPARKKQKVAVRKAEPGSNGETATEAESSSSPTTEQVIPTLPFKRITDDEKRKWGGFCEIESDPSFFNAILHDWGVRGAMIREVLGLDEELLALLPRPIYGFIFLYRYHDIVTNNQEASCPSHVWFANQTHDFACATVSLLNIVFNIPSLDLGENLAQFKDYTQDFTPATRGDQIGHWTFVKSVHNSFARRMDISNIDLGLKNQFDDRNKKNKASPRKKRPTKKKVRGKRNTKGVVTDEDWEEGDDEDNAAFHFVAFVPIAGAVWRLDGLNRQPEKLPGRYETEIIDELPTQTREKPSEQTVDKNEATLQQLNGSLPSLIPQNKAPIHEEESKTWLDIALPHLQEMMLSVESGGGMEFNLLALVQDPLTSHKCQLAQDIESLRSVEQKMDEVYPGPRWRTVVLHDEEAELEVRPDGFANMPGDVVRISDLRTETELPIGAAELPDVQYSFSDKICHDSTNKKEFADLLASWHDLVGRLTRSSSAVREGVDMAAQDLEKARQRRSDYSPVIWTWLKMLSEKEGLLRDMVEIMEAST